MFFDCKRYIFNISLLFHISDEECSSNISRIDNLSTDLRYRLLLKELESAVKTNDLKTLMCLIRKESNATIASQTLFEAARYGNQS